MTDRDEGAHALTNEQAAEILRHDPVLTAGTADPHDEQPGTDDDATTPDGAVTEED